MSATEKSSLEKWIDAVLHEDGKNLTIGSVRTMAMIRQEFKRLYSIEQERDELKQWKKEATLVMPDFQKIGAALGVKLGASVHDKILPGIEKLIEERDRYKFLMEGVSTYLSGWREAIGLLEDHTADQIKLKNMVAAMDQIDETAEAIHLTTANPSQQNTQP